ncbi:hypothetical protein DC366_02980 [Pelagivirga sediminicola]|uniref:Lipoprotein n=1 Tax=Pelagivirga sediminicola TaxID=2170575 RepID=A0A2T7GBW5_9RHOB|nr:hypothetical protein [Pelagivirga sediminicola]PVA11907.1 hypothetical protein DC366_02980 [Pelagivirga sediminicola]
MSRARRIPAGARPPVKRARLRPAGLCAGALCLAALALAGCKRTDEATLRAQLADWVPLGETVSFTATRDCAAGVFQLVGPRLASRLRSAGSVREAVMILKSRSQVAIDSRRLSPDAALLELVEVARAPGMRMRMAGLEGRACMDRAAEAAFGAALVNPRAVVIMDVERGILALLDADDALLVAAMGAQ